MDELLKMPQTPKGMETLNNILSAAAQLIYEKGYYGANIADITKLAGVATGTFYVYFSSKISLYRYLLLQFGHQIRKEMSQKTANCQTRREAEREGLRAWLEYVRKHPYVYNIIWESLYVDRNLFKEYYETFSKAYSSGLSLAQENGEVKDIDLSVLSYMLMGISNFVGLKYCLLGDGSANLDTVVDEAMRVLDGGMFTGETPVKKERAAKPRKDMNFRVEVDFGFLENREREGDK